MAIHTRTPDTKNKNNPLVIAGLAALIMLSWALQTPEAHWSVR